MCYISTEMNLNIHTNKYFNMENEDFFYVKLFYSSLNDIILRASIDSLSLIGIDSCTVSSMALKYCGQ